MSTRGKANYVFTRSRADAIKRNVVSMSELAKKLAEDERFRKRLISAVEHGSEAARRARGGLGVRGTIRGLARDDELLAELRAARADLQRAYRRGEAKTRTHGLRKLLVFGALAAIAAVPRLRERVMDVLGKAIDSRGPSLEELTKEELYARAQKADIPGRSEMSKEELVSALRASV